METNLREDRGGQADKTLTLMGNVENKLTVKARYAPLQQSLLNYHQTLCIPSQTEKQTYLQQGFDTNTNLIQSFHFLTKTLLNDVAVVVNQLQFIVKYLFVSLELECVKNNQNQEEGNGWFSF